jgi:hypothetical protein
MAWRNAYAIDTLKSELKIVFPLRDTESDGTIGDAAHASRTSDHNPFVIVNGTGIVRAFDIDEDLDGNPVNNPYDARAVFDHLLKLARAGDKRIRYIIYEGLIYSDKYNFVARIYTGTNAHKKHIHLSLSLEERYFDSKAPWGFLTPQLPKPTTPSQEDALMAVSEEDFNDLVEQVNNLQLRVIHLVNMIEGDRYEDKGPMPKRIRDGVAANASKLDDLLARE